MLDSFFVPTNPGIDLTILRTVGVLSVVSDQAAAVEDQMGAFGMIIVTENARAIGVTAMPDPVTDAGDDGWFVYQSFAQKTNAGGADPSKTYMLNSKAKRIIQGTGVNIALMVKNAHATHGLQYAILIRILAQVRGTR